MGVNDVSIIGAGKDTYNDDLPGMVDGRILPWVEDSEADGYPVWTDYDAVQRSTYFFNRDGELVNSFNITPYLPDDPDDYSYLINYILDPFFDHFCISILDHFEPLRVSISPKCHIRF